MRSRRAIEAELRVVNDAINDLYWTFTRTARGKPPCLVRPDLYTRRAALLRERSTVTRPRRARAARSHR